MAYIYYFAGKNRGGKLVSIAIGMANDPHAHLYTMNGNAPFDLSIFGLEEGNQERLESLREEFKALHFKGPWFKPSPVLVKHIDLLEKIELPGRSTKKRVSLDLDPEEFHDLELMVGELGEKMKSKVLRRALRFYRGLLRYKAQGYMIQAVRGGTMIQFPNLDDVREPDDS